MASPTRWTWVWVSSGTWWWTGRPGLLRFTGSQRVGYDWASELNWTEVFSWEPAASGKHCFPLLPALPQKRQVKTGGKVRASVTNRVGTASSSTWTSANELASRRKDKYIFSYCFSPHCLQPQCDTASCLWSKVWDQALSLWSVSTDSKTLHYQRTKPRECQIVRTHTKETNWVQDPVSHNHQ